MKKLGVVCAAMLILLAAYIWNINEKYGNPAEYTTIHADTDEWKQEVRIITDEKSLNGFLGGIEYESGDELSGFDSEYFSENIIAAVMVTEPSGEVRHEVLTLREEDGLMIIRIKRTLPRSVSPIKTTFVHFVTVDRDLFAGCDDVIIEFI